MYAPIKALNQNSPPSTLTSCVLHCVYRRNVIGARPGDRSDFVGKGAKYVCFPLILCHAKSSVDRAREPSSDSPFDLVQSPSTRSETYAPQLRRRRVRRFVSDHFMPRDLFIRAYVCLCVFRGAIRLEPRVDSRRPRVVGAPRAPPPRSFTFGHDTARISRKYERSKQPHVAKQPYASIASASAHVPFPLCSRRTPSRSAPAHLSKHGAAAASRATSATASDRPRATPTTRSSSSNPSRANADEGDDGRARQRAQQRRGRRRSVGVTTIPRDDGADERSGSNRRRSRRPRRGTRSDRRIAREFTRRGVR